MEQKKIKGEEAKERLYFPFFNTFVEALDNLGDEKTELELYRAISHYGAYGKEPELSGLAKAIWTLIKPVLGNSRKQFENGAKGGAPKGNCNAIKQPKFNPNSTQEQPKNKPIKEKGEKEKDIEKEKSTSVDTKKTAQRFSRPSLDEVRDYIASQSYSVDAEAFIDFYEAKGWRVGSNPMKDWRAAVRTWERRNRNEGKATTKKQDGSTPTYTHRPSDTPQTVDVCGVSVTLGVNEYIDANGRRTYGTGKATIPQSAPPRPGDKHTWDEASKNWILL